jgi:hypothetical protein
MQLTEMIRDLRREKEQLEQIITLFEDLQPSVTSPRPLAVAAENS